MLVNKRARHEYQILETYEAGIVLKGSEVKSIREGRVSFTDSFVRIKDGEMWLCNLHIAPYSSTHESYDPKRERKLLLHKKEIKRLTGMLSQKGLTLIPLRIYFRKSLAKVEVGLAKGRKKYDKREKLKREYVDKEVRRVLKGREKFNI